MTELGRQATMVFISELAIKLCRSGAGFDGKRCGAAHGGTSPILGRRGGTVHGAVTT